MIRSLSTFAAITAMSVPLSVAAHSGKSDMPGIIHVTATASADAIPDRASVSAGVQTSGKTAQEAMAKNAELMTRVFATLAANGIAEEDVSTTNLNLSPRYDYEQRTNGQPRLVGYQTSNQITVISRDLDRTGLLIDALIKAGVNNINGINFVVSDTESAQTKARTAAIKKAQVKARQMAHDANVSLGRLLSLREGSAPGPIGYNDVVMARSESLNAAPPLAPGQRDISSTVTLSYTIVD